MEHPRISRSMSGQSTSSRNNPKQDVNSAGDDEMEDGVTSSTEPPDSTSKASSTLNSDQSGAIGTGGEDGQRRLFPDVVLDRPSQQQLTPQATMLSTSTIAKPKKVSRTPSTTRKSTTNVDTAKKEAAAIAASCAAQTQSNSNANSKDGSQASDSDNPANAPSTSGTAPVAQKKAHAGPKHRWTADETDALVEGCNKYGIGNWTAILYDEELVGRFDNRIPGDLKDRFRTYFTDTYHELYPNAKTHHGHIPRGKDAEGKSIFAKGKARERRPFTPAEDEAIKAGFDQHGAHWATIAKDAIFQGLRRPTDLRDRFRNAFPARYAELGYKARPAKPKKDRSASSSSAPRPAINSFASLGPAGSAAAGSHQNTTGSAVLSDSDVPLTSDRTATASSANSVSGDFSLSEASDAEHEVPARRSSFALGQPSLGSVGRSTSYQSHMASSQQMSHSRSGSGDVVDAPPYFPPNFNFGSNPRPAPSFSNHAISSEQASPFFATSAYDGYDFNFPPQQLTHPKSASAGMESQRKSSEFRDSGAGLNGLRRSQSSKRANPKISNFEGMSSQSQPASGSGSRPSSVASHPLFHPGTISARPGLGQSFSADHTQALNWQQAASTSAVDFAQVMSSTSHSQLLSSSRSNDLDSMDLDGPLQQRAPALPNQSSNSRAAAAHPSVVSSNQQPQSRLLASHHQVTPYQSLVSSEFTPNVGSNSPKPRSNSIHGQAWNASAPTSVNNRPDGAIDVFRDRYNFESMLDPSNATPTTGGSWVWIPHGSTGPASVGGHVPPPPPGPPPSGPPPGYPYSHPFAGDLHVNDELPSFVDLASMHLPDGTNNSGMTEQFLAQVRAQSAHSASESSLSIHSGHERGEMDLDVDVDMDLGGMEMEMQSVPMSDSRSLQSQRPDDFGSSNSVAERFGIERSSAPGSAYGIEDPGTSLTSPAPRRLSHPPRPSQVLQRSAYRSSAFAADDLALTLGSQTLFTPNQQHHRRRRSTDTLNHGNLQSSAADLGLSLEGLGGDKADEVEKDQNRMTSAPTPPSVHDRSQQEGIDTTREFSLDGSSTNVGGAPFSDPPSADLDPSYAASLPDTSMQTDDALSNSGFQQFSYDDIDLPSLLNRSPIRQSMDSQQPLNFDFNPTHWGTNNNFLGNARAMSMVPGESGSGSPDIRFLGNHPKAWSDYGIIEGSDRDSVFPFATNLGGPIKPESDQSSRASSSINGWEGSEAGLSGVSGHARSRDPSQGHLDEFFMEHDPVARSRTPGAKTAQAPANSNSRDSSSQRDGF